MTAVVLPTHGRWAWDVRGDGRAVRVSTHAESGLLNVSFWRDDICVGTARLGAEDVAGLVNGLTDGLAELAARPGGPVADPGRLHELELRLARLEHEQATRRPMRSRVLPAVRTWVTRAALRARPPAVSRPGD